MASLFYVHATGTYSASGFTCSSEEVWGAPYSGLHKYLSGIIIIPWVYCLKSPTDEQGQAYFTEDFITFLFQCYIFLDDPYSTAQLLEKLAKGSKVRFWCSALTLFSTLMSDDLLPNLLGWQFSSISVGIWSLRWSNTTLLEESSRGHTSLASGSAQSPTHYTGRGSPQYTCTGNRRVLYYAHVAFIAYASAILTCWGQLIRSV